MLSRTRTQWPALLFTTLLVTACNDGAAGPLPPDPEAPTITTTSLPDGMVGWSYSEVLTATGGTAPYAWSLSAGALPGGLELSSSGLISGIPDAEGLSTFTVRVAGSDGPSSSASLTIDVFPDVYAPGTEWGGGDWPTLISPALNEDVIIGDPVPRVTVPFDGDFKPLLNAVQGDAWHLRITRPEWACDTQVDKYPTGLHWSHDLPKYTYYFDVCWGFYDSELKTWNVNWPLTQNYRLQLMQNGQWISRIQLPTYWFDYDDNDYYVERWFTVQTQPELHLSLTHAWMVGTGPDADRIFVEGPVTIEHRVQSGVEITDTKTFTETLGWSAGIDIKGISAGLSQTFEKSSTHTVSLETETETIETKFYDVPANERWRFIQMYGVDRYVFSDADGNSWDSPTLTVRNLGNVDSKTRNVLMIVKYRGGSSASYATEFLEIFKDGTIVAR